MQRKLVENETFSNLEALEKKWSQLEQTNFNIREFIANKRAENNPSALRARAKKLMAEYNTMLIEIYQAGGDAN